MDAYEVGLQKLSALFSQDRTFVLATVKESKPSQRVVDTYYDEGVFWIVTYAQSNKVKELRMNPQVSLCNSFHTFNGLAYYAGHPLDEQNKDIRAKLIQVFEPRYFAHNNEADKDMCYVRIELTEGFFHTDGFGYIMDFTKHEAKIIPFTPQISLLPI